jgi:hypothetical protein
MQILCSKYGSLGDDFNAATCQNLDIACDTCNFWSCDDCATLYNLAQVPKKNCKNTDETALQTIKFREEKIPSNRCII